MRNDEPLTATEILQRQRDLPDFQYARVPGRPRWYLISWFASRAGSDGADEEANGARLKWLVGQSKRRKMVDFGQTIAVTERSLRWLRRELSGSWARGSDDTDF